jgi:hypothetical protein
LLSEFVESVIRREAIKIAPEGAWGGISHSPLGGSLQ